MRRADANEAEIAIGADADLAAEDGHKTEHAQSGLFGETLKRQTVREMSFDKAFSVVDPAAPGIRLAGGSHRAGLHSGSFLPHAGGWKPIGRTSLQR